MSNLALVSEPCSTEPGVEPLIKTAVASLSRCELIGLEKLAEGVTLEALTSKLWVSRNTVKPQVRSVYRKIGVCTRADAVACANAAGLR